MKAINGKPRIVDDHIPPMRLGGGSFLIELKHQLAPTGDGNDNDPRPMIYSTPNRPEIPENEQYGAISRILVVKESEHDLVPGWIPGPGPDNTFDPSDNAELRIWLQKVKRRAKEEHEFDNIPAGRAPDAIVRGGPPLRVELDNDLEDRQPTNKYYRRNRYRHKGYNRRFRIGKWQIVAGGRERAHDSGAENYDFLVFFGDPTK
jgi:hypothetical protein